MKAKEIIKIMCSDSEIAEACMEWCYDAPMSERNKWEMLDNYFGDSEYHMGELVPGSMYLCHYSDVKKGWLPGQPDFTLVLSDGRCIFFYKVED